MGSDQRKRHVYHALDYFKNSIFLWTFSPKNNFHKSLAYFLAFLLKESFTMRTRERPWTGFQWNRLVFACIENFYLRFCSGAARILRKFRMLPNSFEWVAPDDSISIHFVAWAALFRFKFKEQNYLKLFSSKWHRKNDSDIIWKFGFEVLNRI